MLTIDEAIKKLQYARLLLGGDKPLLLCLTGSEGKDVEVNSLEIVNEGIGQYVVVKAGQTAPGEESGGRGTPGSAEAPAER